MIDEIETLRQSDHERTLYHQEPQIGLTLTVHNNVTPYCYMYTKTCLVIVVNIILYSFIPRPVHAFGKPQHIQFLLVKLNLAHNVHSLSQRPWSQATLQWFTAHLEHAHFETLLVKESLRVLVQTTTPQAHYKPTCGFTVYLVNFCLAFPN